MILVTGGSGYIGSHTLVELVREGYDIVVLDNLSNSSIEAIRRVEKLTESRIIFKKGDIRNRAVLEDIFNSFNIEGVIHFAGLKAVGESVKKPSLYYENNFCGTIQLCCAMEKAEVFNLVFSSSATVYGDPASVPIKEMSRTGGTTNPYGTSKYMVERYLSDLCLSNDQWKISCLRYFNPIGAHPSGVIGEDPNEIPNNLVPYITQVAVGRLAKLSIFGGDYKTHDGTGVRDYIHVVDLAKGHLAALRHLHKVPGFHCFNLGTGNGYSVLDVVNAFEKVSGIAIPYEIAARRSGDIAECYADPSLAERVLDWRAICTIEEMMADAWRWQSNNPEGYSK